MWRPHKPSEKGGEKMSSQVRLKLLPSIKCMFDEPIQVKVAGLRPRQVVSMRAKLTDDKGVVFSSSATYRANGNGEVDLKRDPSLGGSYIGVEPMGLLCSMRPLTMHKIYLKTNAINPQVVKFSVHEEEGRLLAEMTNERLLMRDGVTRVPVNEGNICGVLFTPPGKGPFPAVLDLPTSVSEARPSLLANKGFVVLSMAVYNKKGENSTETHLDHFEEAMNFLKQQPKVGSKGVGIMSRCKGANIGLSLAAFVPGVEAIVCINACNANVVTPLYYKKQQILSSLLFDESKFIPTESGAIIIKDALEDPLAEKNKGSLIPIERAKTHFLFAAVEDDLNWDSKAYMDEMVVRLKHHGKENFETVFYPGAGHMLEPPYAPHCPSSFNAGVGKRVLWGGEPKAHIAAEIHLWKKIQDFFKTHLSCDATQNKAKL
ncbi:acyl-coenzyme A thioesterase 5-like isoform X3 [Oreochromis aureus]|uniref:Acyl-CoA thioesterase 21 n=1 Tax=Oreochromis aureus TaxID=47969 RepID=A0A668UZQ7_OREAU|nr:acyl-coenzyme A thioesterase 5-like isoform X3 [Oreochromis aureus]